MGENLPDNLTSPTNAEPIKWLIWRLILTNHNLIAISRKKLFCGGIPRLVSGIRDHSDAKSAICAEYSNFFHRTRPTCLHGFSVWRRR
jgi:hypothetical protein